MLFVFFELFLTGIFNFSNSIDIEIDEMCWCPWVVSCFQKFSVFYFCLLFVFSVCCFSFFHLLEFRVNIFHLNKNDILRLYLLTHCKRKPTTMFYCICFGIQLRFYYWICNAVCICGFVNSCVCNIGKCLIYHFSCALTLTYVFSNLHKTGILYSCVNLWKNEKII